jgi:hypothetical protein
VRHQRQPGMIQVQPVRNLTISHLGTGGDVILFVLLKICRIC